MRIDTPHQSFSIGSVGKWDSNDEKQYEMKHLGPGFEEFNTKCNIKSNIWRKYWEFSPTQTFYNNISGFLHIMCEADQPK